MLAGAPTPENAALTLRQLADRYIADYVDVDRAATKAEYVYALDTVCGTAVPRPDSERVVLGNWLVTDIDRDVVRRFKKERLGQPPRGTAINPPRGGKVGVNRNVRLLRAVFNWAVDNNVGRAKPALGEEAALKGGEAKPPAGRRPR